jgi:hypothetical protein
MVYLFGSRLELIVVRISVNAGIRKYRIFFILDSRITRRFSGSLSHAIYKPRVTVWI